MKIANWITDLGEEKLKARRDDICAYYCNKYMAWGLVEDIIDQKAGIDMWALDEDFNTIYIQQKFDSFPRTPKNIYCEWDIQWMDNNCNSPGWAKKQNQKQDYFHIIFEKHGLVLCFKWVEFQKFLLDNEKVIKQMDLRHKKNTPQKVGDDNSITTYSLIDIEWLGKNYKGFFEKELYKVGEEVV